MANKQIFLLLALQILTMALGSDIGYWDYDQPANWGIGYPTCNGNRQSPIHIRSATSYVLPLPPINFGYYDIFLSGNKTLINNGHTVDFEVPMTRNNKRPFVSGAIMKSKYEAMGVHFHWGSRGNKGSEHIINNRRYDVEMHIVHKNVKYATITEAAEHKDGLAVLAIMFKIVNVPDRYYPGLNKIFNKLLKVMKYKSTASISGQISLGQLLGDLNTTQFFTYSGSLTTPNCAQAVIWNVFPEPLSIAYEHIKKFWSITDEHGELLINNYRPIQNRNKRPVFHRVGGFKDSNFIIG